MFPSHHFQCISSSCFKEIIQVTKAVAQLSHNIKSLLPRCNLYQLSVYKVTESTPPLFHFLDMQEAAAYLILPEKSFYLMNVLQITQYPNLD